MIFVTLTSKGVNLLIPAPMQLPLDLGVHDTAPSTPTSGAWVISLIGLESLVKLSGSMQGQQLQLSLQKLAQWHPPYQDLHVSSLLQCVLFVVVC